MGRPYLAVRLAQSDDIGALAAIERSAAELFRGTVMELAIDDSALERAILESALSENTLWIAEHDGVPVGFLCGSRQEALLYIDELAVAAEYQGHGLGRALLARCILEARGWFDGIALTTDRELPWNGPFYARSGFVECVDPPAAVAAKIDEEIAHGFDPDRRCAMILVFG